MRVKICIRFDLNVLLRERSAHVAEANISASGVTACHFECPRARLRVNVINYCLNDIFTSALTAGCHWPPNAFGCELWNGKTQRKRSSEFINVSDVPLSALCILLFCSRSRTRLCLFFSRKFVFVLRSKSKSN